MGVKHTSGENNEYRIYWVAGQDKIGFDIREHSNTRFTFDLYDDLTKEEAIALRDALDKAIKEVP